MLLSAIALNPATSATSAPEELDATRARPLFAPTRRPPPMATPDRVAPIEATIPDASPKFEVRGIIVGDRRRIAILRRPGSPQTIDVALGSEIDGWTVADIHPRGITLRRATRVVTLDMPEPGR